MIPTQLLVHQSGTLYAVQEYADGRLQGLVAVTCHLPQCLNQYVVILSRP